MKKRLSNKVYLITFYVCLAASYSCRGKASTTIGARELNYCVRYGNRCDLSAITTRQTFSFLKMYIRDFLKMYFLVSLIQLKYKRIFIGTRSIICISNRSEERRVGKGYRRCRWTTDW